MPVKLPLVPSVASYRVGTALDGVQYLLDVRWNTRAAAWYLDILADDETPIRRGIKIVLGAALGSRCALATFPRGALIAADLLGTGVDPTFDDLGTRVIVNFYTVAELQALFG